MPQLLNSFLSAFLLFLLCFPFHSKAAGLFQQGPAKVTLAGMVVDSASQAVIPYASIGLVGESMGTVSNEVGIFSLSLPLDQAEKILRISAIGFEAREVKLKEFASSASSRQTILLVAKPVQLAEVNVKARPWKAKKIGGSAGPITMFHHNFGVFQRPIQENLGRELGILIPNGDKPAYLSKLNFCLTTNQYDQVKFRVKVYSLQDGKPASNLTPQDIFYTVTNKGNGWQQVDLAPYHLEVNHDFAIALEWVDCMPLTQNNSLTISASMPGFQTSFYKDASQATWSKMSAIGMGMNVEVLREM